MLPDTRDQSCTSSTPIYPGTINDLQDWLVRLWRATAGSDLLLTDDFMGGFAPFWTATATGANTDTAEDVAAGGFGVARMRPDAGTLDYLRSILLPMSARRFRFACRMRWNVSPAQAGTHAWVGLADWNTQDVLVLGISAGQTNWHMVQRLNMPGTDTGVVADNGLYHTFQLSSDGTTVTLLIDGATVWTGTHPAAWNPRLELLVSRDVADGAIDLRVDRVALWVAA